MNPMRINMLGNLWRGHHHVCEHGVTGGRDVNHTNSRLALNLY